MAALSSPIPLLTVPRLVPALLAFVAGTVDAVTVLALFGLFVAQVTGSFVTIGVQLVTREPHALIGVLAIPLFFIGGAAIVFVIEAQGRAGRALAAALAIEAALLAGFMAAGVAAAPFKSLDAPIAMLAGALGLLAMGVQSAAVRRVMRGIASTNVMTTNTTMVAVDVAEWIIMGWRSWRVPEDAAQREACQRAAGRLASLMPIMIGFFAGSIYGALGYLAIGFWSLALAVVILLGVIGWALRGLT